MSGRFVRDSRFRHVFGEANKMESCYTDVKSLTSGDGNFIAVNQKYFCVAKQGGGGPVYVHSVGDYGRFGLNHPLLNVHKAQVLDFDWNPFDDDVLATGGDDCSVCVTRIPEDGMTKNINEPDVEMMGHSKKVSLLHWHPTANNVLASSGYDKDIKVWDVTTGEEMMNVIHHPENVQSFEWSADGSMMLSTCRDRMIRVFDPRQEPLAHEFEGHEGTKQARCFWMPEMGMVGSVGFSRNSQRKILFWDLRKPGEMFHRTDLDQAASVLCPFYDPDVSMLYLAGKGDGNVRFFEATNQEGFCHFLADFRSNTPQKGSSWMPKRAVDVGNAELAMFYRLTRDYVQPVSMRCPRRNANAVFQEDLYPDCYAGKPSQEGEDYFKGQNADPKKVSLKPESMGSGRHGTEQSMRRSRTAKTTSTKKANGGGVDSKAITSPKINGDSAGSPAKKKRQPTSYKPPKSSTLGSKAGAKVAAAAASSSKSDSGELAAVKKEYNELQSSKESVEDDLRSSVRKVAALTKENNALKQELSTMKEDQSQLHVQLEEMEETVNIQADKIKHLTSQLAKLI